MRHYGIKCVKSEVYQPAECKSLLRREYETGLLFTFDNKRVLIRSGYRYHTVGQRFYLSDPYGASIDFIPGETDYTYQELLQLLEGCGCCNFNIESSQVTDNGDGTYSIEEIIDPVEGSLAFDELGNVYEFNGEFWTLKSSFPTYQEGDNIDIDYSDPANPIINGICSVQTYDTFADFPEAPDECVLYIDEETKRQYILGFSWSEIPGITLNDSFSSVNDLPVPGDPSIVYVFGLPPKTWYWDGTSYIEIPYVTNLGDISNPPATDFVYVVNTNQLFEAGETYLDVSPPTTNLFTADLTLTENRTHDMSVYDLNFDIVSPVSQFRIKRKDTLSFPRTNIEYRDREILQFVEVTQGNNIGIHIDNKVHIVTGQATPETGQFLRLSASGVEWEDITVPEYASDTDADNDADLPSGALYAITGDRTVKRKP